MKPCETAVVNAWKAPLREVRPASTSAARIALILGPILVAFLVLELLLPLGKVVKIGADEDFELTKATLCLKGTSSYTEIWDDQPPLMTFLVARVIQQAPRSILAPRLMTVCFALVLLSAVFLLIRESSGLLAAGLAAGMLAVSPGFIELSSSCMQEIPALAPVAAGLCAMQMIPKTRWRMAEILGGLLFAAGLQMKVLAKRYPPRQPT